jgi:hypothetical protein
MSQLLSTYSISHQSKSPNSILTQTSSPASGDAVMFPVSDIIPADTQEASSLLDLFRSEMMPLFPFVNILPSATPHSLLQEKPILYLAILVAASQNDLQKQMGLVKILREEISRRFLTSSEQDLGLLEGLLVYLAW